MTDSEITELLTYNNGTITMPELNDIRSYDITAYNIKHMGNGTYQMDSRWGGCWQFMYRQ